VVQKEASVPGSIAGLDLRRCLASVRY